MNLMEFVFGHSAGCEAEVQLATARRVLEQLLHSSAQGRGIGSLLSYLDLAQATSTPIEAAHTVDRTLYASVMDNARASRDWLANMEKALSALTSSLTLSLMPGSDAKEKLEKVIAQREDAILIRKHNLETHFDVNAGAILANAEALTDIFEELLVNALKYSPAASRISVATRFRSGRFELEVANLCENLPSVQALMNGASQKALLKPFFKAANQIDDRYAGLRFGIGIGLTIAEYNARQMNGALEIDEEKDPETGGRNLTVRIVLPALG